MVLMFWVHIITQLTFLNFLPLGKHFHVVTSLPNVFLTSLGYPHEKVKLLDLHEFNDSLKGELYAMEDNLIKRAELASQLSDVGDTDAGAKIKEEMMALYSERPLVGEVIAPDTLWACTTCRACEQVCPVIIEHVRIIAMRQGQGLVPVPRRIQRYSTNTRMELPKIDPVITPLLWSCLGPVPPCRIGYLCSR